MTEAPSTPALLWHPFTPKGVAGAAAAPRWQVWIAMGLTATLAVFSLLNFLNQCWRPVIVEAIEHLEDGGLIRNGILQPGGAKTDATLARNRHLAIGLNWTDTSLRDQASDVRVFLQLDRALVCSLFGCVAVSYKSLGDMPIGRTETGAWWRAWSPFLNGAAALGLVLFLIVSWWLLGILYAWAIRLLAFYLDRQVDFTGAARVAQAALIPGALWLTAALFAYANDWLDLVGLLVVFVMHVPVGWLYAGLAGRNLPPRPDVLPTNPFQPSEPPESPAPVSAENPFGRTGE